MGADNPFPKPKRARVAVQKMHNALLGAAMALVPSASLSAGYDEGLAAYQAGNHERAAAVMLANAEDGDPRAQYFVSSLYRSGTILEQDEDKAFYWCSLAAEGGLLEAQFQLGVMYLRGEGVDEDRIKALDWLWNAADRGYPQAKDVLEYVLHGDEFSFGC
jgi:TPR repeat protein